MNCKNCGEIVESTFCGNCGQASKVEKITLATLSRDFTEDILQVNKGFFYTVIKLFTRPGYSIRAYLEGKRKNYFRPITYLLLLSTIYFFFAKLTGSNTWMNDAIIGFAKGAKDIHGDSSIPSVVSFLADNYAYTTLVLLPFFALASFICFPKAQANYLEHIVINAYITGQQAIIYTIFAIITTQIKYDFLESIPVLFGMLYCFWVFYQFFDNGNRVINIARTICTYIIYIVFSSFIFFVVLAISEVNSW